jgi:hypothetical protein
MQSLIRFLVIIILRTFESVVFLRSLYLLFTYVTAVVEFETRFVEANCHCFNLLFADEPSKLRASHLAAPTFENTGHVGPPLTSANKLQISWVLLNV